jgi:hypothetical protein
VTDEERLNTLLGTAVLGIDTLWGGDVMSSSGTGRFIADSWFSGEPLPEAYTHETAQAVRQQGGVGGREPAREAIEAYLSQVDVPGAIEGLAEEARTFGGLRGAYLDGLVVCFAVMWELAMERLGRADPVPYERCVRASTGAEPAACDGREGRERLGALLGRAGYPADDEDGLLAAVDAWRGERRVPARSIATLGDAFIARLDRLTLHHVMPLLPSRLHGVPRANIQFLPIQEAWFSGSMNYLGRARRPDGRPEYEATYEINASLEISVPEFEALVAHEVVPGHVTTFAFLQDQHHHGELGFEASVPTMNTRGATLSEGLANNAVLMAHNVVEVDELPDEDLQIGVRLALLQDDAKSQASYLTWKESVAEEDVAGVLRREFLCSEERSGKLAGAWGRHPLLGRMYLPAYRAGTRRVAELRRRHPATAVIPSLFGCRGLVDIVTVERAILGS